MAWPQTDYDAQGAHALQNNVVKENPDLFKSKDLLLVNNSIESLSPKSKILPVMLSAKKAPWVTYHNIVGRLPPAGYFSLRSSTDGDGVVEYTSARFPDAVSEIEVPADHVNVHRHPLSVLEVRRILLEHKSAMPIIGPWKNDDKPNPTAGQRQKQEVLPASLQQGFAPAAYPTPQALQNALPSSNNIQSGDSDDRSMSFHLEDQHWQDQRMPDPNLGVTASDETDMLELPVPNSYGMPREPTLPFDRQSIPMADLPSAMPTHR